MVTKAYPMAEAVEEDAGGRSLVESEAGAVAAVAREEAEIKAAIIVAHKFPRDEANASAKILKSCERPTFAAGAAYKFPRGGQQVEGPSVELAREMARCWGNLRYGIRIVTDDDERIHIKGYCLDVETNALVEVEDKFKKLVFRKQGGWIKPDERDLRELVNRRGAICERNAILKSMPPDVIEDALARAKVTLTKAASGEIKQDKAKTIRSLVAAYLDLGVTADMIRQYLGHELDIVNEQELVDLRQVWKSISDGNSRREEHFEIPKPKGPETGSLDASAIGGGTSQERTAPAKPAPAINPDGSVSISDQEAEAIHQREVAEASGAPAPKPAAKKNSLF